ncbi:hypothetical protein NO135_22775, partial [Clostridioides difficile]|nr:hypothetical protein [Clostridioides difficile]
MPQPRSNSKRFIWFCAIRCKITTIYRVRKKAFCVPSFAVLRARNMSRNIMCVHARYDARAGVTIK